jgi:hypothetical protein
MRRTHAPLIWILLAGVVSCGGDGRLPSPTLRVDLRDKLPRKALRRLLAVDTTYACSREVTLRVPDASQRFRVSWRVFDYKALRYITAVQVAPLGLAEGASGPAASATVGEPTAKGDVTTVPIQISFSGRAGCTSFTAGRQVQLRSNDPGCKKPTSKIRIWKDSEKVEPEKKAGEEGSPASAPAAVPASGGAGAR